MERIVLRILKGQQQQNEKQEEEEDEKNTIVKWFSVVNINDRANIYCNVQMRKRTRNR